MVLWAGACVSYFACDDTINLTLLQYVHINLPTKLSDPTDLWLNYPHIPIAGPVKFYYLMQTAFYLHQVLILNAEARRKDHVQMMTHHVITIALIGASYYANFTRVGCVILVIMDWCDIWFPVSIEISNRHQYLILFVITARQNAALY
jgi:acyl-CoA-dependent ceramide synthase